jgi:outer membrane protein OmpA-like peptidoglycan-associated protein
MHSVFLITALMAAPAERVPFVPGLTVISVVSAPIGDYEVLRTLDSVNAKGYRLVTTGDVPADDDTSFIPLSLARRVRAADQLHSRNVRLTWHSSDRENMSGNVPGLSCDVIAELRSTGKSQITYLYVVPVAGIAITRNKLQGVMSVVDRKPYSVLVNRARVALPALHISGTLSDGEVRKVLDLQVSDDPDNPLVLRAHVDENELRVASIEFPLARDTLERKLATADSVELSGIYFQFGSATLRPESDALLSQLAGVLKAHPDWQFRLDGHTDSVGTDSANQGLSARRSGAVRTALVERFGVSAGQLTARGLGETQPRESNDTDSGRARNRRVELVRMNPKPKQLPLAQQASAPVAPFGSACRFAES